MKPTIHYPDFEKLDVRTGLILSASVPDWSEKLLEFEVDLGSEIGTKVILSGVKAWYKPEEFLGKKFLFIVNLAERKMGEGVSQGMMLMSDDGTRPYVIPAPDDCQPGWVVR